MYLSQMILNPRDRRVRRDLADPSEMHRTLLQLFVPEAEPTAFRARHGVLFRIEPRTAGEGPVVLMQSITEPDWSRLAVREAYFLQAGKKNPATKSVDAQYDSLAEGQALQFRLRANPTKKIDTKTRADGTKSNGKRVPLREPEALAAWLWRKGEQGGFAPAGDPRTSVRANPEEDVIARRKGNRSVMTFGAVLYEGRLRITDANAFRAMLQAGVGPGKAFGFGLLSVARIRGESHAHQRSA